MTRETTPVDFNEEPTLNFQLPILATDPTTKHTGDAWVNTASHEVKVQTDSTHTSVLTHKFAGNVGDGVATSLVVTHNLNTLDVVVQAHLITTGVVQAPTSITLTSANAVTIVMGVAPATNNLRVVVLGAP